MQVILAQISKRIIASLVDYMLFSIAYAMVLMAFGKKITQDDGSPMIELTGYWNIIPIVLWIVTFPVMESFEGKTIGKKLMKLQVMKLNGSPYNGIDAFKRRLCDWIDFSLFGLPGFIIASNTSLRQRLGDLWAGTVIVEDPGVESPANDEATGE